MILLLLTLLSVEASPTAALHDAIWRAEMSRQRPSTFDTWLQHPDEEVRSAATRSLGRLKQADALERLRVLLEDESPSVRAEAAFGLGLTPGGAAVLMEGRVEEHPVVLARTFDALGLQGDSEAIPWLIEGMAGKEPASRAAAVAIGRIGMARKEAVDHPQIIKELVYALDLDQMERRRGAAFALARIGPTTWPDAELARTEKLAESDYDPLVRSRLVRALTAERSGQSVVPLLSTVVNDRAPEVRIAAARALKKLPADRAKSIGIQLLNDPNELVQVAAAEALVELEDKRLDKVLLALKESPNPALQRVGGARHAMVFDIDHDLEWPIPVMAGWLTKVNYPPEQDGSHHRPFTFFATRHESALIRTVAAGRLLQEEAKPKWGRELLSAEDPTVQAVGIQLLGAHPKRTDWKAIAELLVMDADLDVWMAVVDLTEKALEDRPRTRLPQVFLDRLTLGASRHDLHQQIGALLDQLGQPMPPPMAAPPALPSRSEILELQVARIFTDQGEIRVQLHPEHAPRTVWNFSKLVRDDYFDGLRFHRVVPDFVIQSGCPRGDGWGGPGWVIPDELSALPYTKGTLGMALSGPDTGGSQWFITLSDQPHLEGNYTIFGSIIGDMRIAKRIQLDTQIEDIAIETVGPTDASTDPEASP